MKRTPLLIATELGKVELVQLLLDYGAKPANDCEGNSVLHICAKYGNLELGSLYLKKFNQLNHSKNSNGDTPLHTLLNERPENFFEMLKLFDNYGSGKVSKFDNSF